MSDEPIDFSSLVKTFDMSLSMGLNRAEPGAGD